MPSSIDPARHAQLNAVRLRAVADDAGTPLTGDVTALGAGAAALTADGTGWVLLADLADRGPDQQLGAALAWAVRRDVGSLHVLAERGTGTLARRAAWFSLPVRVSQLDGRVLVAAEPEPLPPVDVVRDDHRALADLIVAGGATPVEEHGVLVGEVDGLEVCRVVDVPETGEVRLEVGVGAHDRETFQLLHGDRPTVEALADVVRAVTQHRRTDAAPHPLKQLAASRLLRSRIVAEPSLVGLDALVAVDPPLARPNLKDQLPCAAVEHASHTLVVCSTGIDLEVVPWAGDAAAMHAARRCVVAVPERDAIDLQHRLAALLRVPTTVVGIAG
jgi:hypothetical protein